METGQNILILHIYTYVLPYSLSPGDKLSVDGEHTLAVEAWKDQLKALAGNAVGAILCIYLLSIKESVRLLSKHMRF